MKYGELILGQIEAIINKLGGMDGVQRFLHGEIVVSEPEPPWREKDGVIYFSVTSDGTSGKKWIKHLERKYITVDDSEKSVFRSSDFQPTKGVTYEIAVLKCNIFKTNNKLYTEDIRAEADKCGFTTPNAEIACLIFEKFSYKELEAMGLSWLITMHKPIKDSDGVSRLLGTGQCDGSRTLGMYYDCPDYTWFKDETGFAFEVSRKQARA